MKEIEIRNAYKSRSFGWGFRTQPTGNGTSIETPTVPDTKGTIHQCLEHKNTDTCFQSIVRGGALVNTAWFYKDQRIISTWRVGLLHRADNVEPFKDEPYEEWDRRNIEHHLKNDVYGYGWFLGFELDQDMWEDGILRVRVDDGKNWTTQSLEMKQKKWNRQ